MYYFLEHFLKFIFMWLRTSGLIFGKTCVILDNNYAKFNKKKDLEYNKLLNA